MFSAILACGEALGLESLKVMHAVVSEASFDKNTTCQGRGMGIRNGSKEYKAMNKNNKTET